MAPVSKPKRTMYIFRLSKKKKKIFESFYESKTMEYFVHDSVKFILRMQEHGYAWLSEMFLKYLLDKNTQHERKNKQMTFE